MILEIPHQVRYDGNSRDEFINKNHEEKFPKEIFQVIRKKENMFETMTLDAKTLIIKSDSEKELSEIIAILNQRNKQKDIESFLDFAASIRKEAKDYKFNRDECYER
jgi:hypothetical protein